MITAGKLVELATGQPLDQVVHDRITGPLGMRDTGYNPPASELDRIAATEYQTAPPRGMVRGSVHDENAWALNGVAGHAGVFSTADDLAVLAQTIINGGSYGDTRILSEDSVDALMHNENAAFPGNSHGLGFELDQMWYMDGLVGPETAGHTGYTGTSIVIDRASKSFVILLTNRVHPSRNWGSNNPARRAVARDMALRPPGAAAGGRDGLVLRCGDARTVTLSTPVQLSSAPSRLTFDLWYDTEPTDVVTLEASSDGGSTWQELEHWSGWSGKRWGSQSVDLGALDGDVTLRWRYASDALYQGRGVYVDGIRVTSPGHVVFDDSRQRDADAVQLAGWSASANLTEVIFLHVRSREGRGHALSTPDGHGARLAGRAAARDPAVPVALRAAGGPGGARGPARGRRQHDHRAGAEVRHLGDHGHPVLPDSRPVGLSAAPPDAGHRVRPRGQRR